MRALLSLPLSLPFAESAEHAEKILGLPAWIWQLANLTLFLAVLVYFVARPLTNAFRARQEAVEKALAEAREKRAEAAGFESQIHERMAKLEREVVEIRRQGAADGESVRNALDERAREEADRIRKDSEEEITRRVAAAKAELQQVAAGLMASTAREIVAREITDEDRRRLLADGVERLKEAR